MINTKELRTNITTITNVACLVLLLAGASLAQAITNDDVIALSKSGLGPDVIIAKIKASEIKFDTSTAALLKLKEANVPDKVIAAMVDKETADKNIVGEIPEQGSLQDLKDKKKAYIYTDYIGPLNVRERLTAALEKAGYNIVDKIEDADFALKWQQWKNPGDRTAEVEGVLEVALIVRPSGTYRRRNVYSVRKQMGHNWFDWVEPVDQAIKQFLKDLKKALK